MLVETNFNDVQAISEGVGNDKHMYISGIFAQGGVVNRNRRLYPSGVLEGSMAEYDRDYVSKSRAVGEAEHPKTTQVNLDRISHIILLNHLVKEGDNYSAKARILNTPCGNIVRGLIEGGVQIGVSTRADGAVKRNSKGIMEVQAGLRMAAIDVVFSPSAPDAFVEGLVENADFIWSTITEDTEFLEQLKEDVRTAKKSNLVEAKVAAFRKAMSQLRV